MDPKQVIEAIEDAGYEPRSYSGRGMCGKECLGVTCHNPVAMVCKVISTFSVRVNDIETVEELIQLLEQARTDSMGLDSIVYWPRLEPPEDHPAPEEG